MKDMNHVLDSVNGASSCYCSTCSRPSYDAPRRSTGDTDRRDCDSVRVYVCHSASEEQSHRDVDIVVLAEKWPTCAQHACKVMCTRRFYHCTESCMHDMMDDNNARHGRRGSGQLVTHSLHNNHITFRLASRWEAASIRPSDFYIGDSLPLHFKEFRPL